MKRNVSKIPIGESQIRTVVRLEGDVCEKGTHESMRELFRLMGDLVQNPGIMSIPAICPDSVSIRHNTNTWVIEIEVVTNREATDGKEGGLA